ncbi:MAG: hypothetical protein JO040_04730 [Gemmatimonadetes bacterium]|nr:hypothetical protein [Gemmatimonadota bacterium]
MLETFTYETFSERLNETFVIRLDDGSPLETRLAQVNLGSEESARGRDRMPFALLFLGPPRPILPQRIYRMENEAMGAFELFLVPVGPGQYEAVFN